MAHNQCRKKLMFDSPGLVDVAFGLMDFILHSLMSRNARTLFVISLSLSLSVIIKSTNSCMLKLLPIAAEHRAFNKTLHLLLDIMLWITPCNVPRERVMITACNIVLGLKLHKSNRVPST